MLPPGIERLVELALDEDLGGGDATSEALVDAALRARGTVIAKEPLVASGLDVATFVFGKVDPAIEVQARARRGARVAPGEVMLAVQGSARSILTAERVALNFLGHLCGVATLTRRFVDAAGEGRARIVDTRKTTPGQRWLERRAVLDGGGRNHRYNLSSGILIKDNHVALYGVRGALERARAHAPHSLRLEIEVTTLAELEEALAGAADVILLDNMSLVEIEQAVARAAGRALLEVSGGVTLETVGSLAASGVDIISIGRLTHSAPASDVSLELELDGRA